MIGSPSRYPLHQATTSPGRIIGVFISVIVLHNKKNDLTKIAKLATLVILVKKYIFELSSEICKLDRQEPNPKIFLSSDNFLYIFLIFKGFPTHNIFQKCRSEKSEPDISPILDFSSEIGKSNPQKPNLKVFLRSDNFFYIFPIFKVFSKKP